MTGKQNGTDSRRKESREEAQNAPTPITTYALFCNGKYLTNEILSDKKFLKLIDERQ